jgi:hypothetical protein
MLKFVCKIDPAEAPSFSFEPQDVIGVKGQEVGLECRAMGDPIPLITWTRIGGESLMFNL